MFVHSRLQILGRGEFYFQTYQRSGDRLWVTVDAKERRQGIRDVRYGIRDTWVDPAEAVPEI
ncbi:hypothetical protein Tco_0476824, partial [Tanacetum coccineum]